jgi:hypothetical protein
MKKKLARGIAGALAVLGVLFFAGCPTSSGSEDKDKDEEKKGAEWISLDASGNPDGLKSFVLYDDLTFSCDITNKVVIYDNAIVEGSLDDSAPGLGEDEYLLKDLVSENPTVNGRLESVAEGKKVKLEYNADKTEFTFSSTNGTVQSFFGGTYRKK